LAEFASIILITLTLRQITAVTNEVNRRVGLIKTFKERVMDDRTYEIRDAGSIHRLLEQAMWIVDERYWLMHSNETVRKIVAKELPKKHERYVSKRPDFVCGMVGNKLIIIEIKRPSHVLTRDDLTQLEDYLLIIDEHHTEHTTVDAKLVGRRIRSDLRASLKYRKGVSVMTYTDLIGDTERRHQDYLNALSNER
jgi:hypothetical protein